MADVAHLRVRPGRAGVQEMRDLAVLSRPAQVRNYAYLGLTWAVALGAIAVFWYHRSWWTFALAFLVVAARQQALLNVEHECVHGKFAGGRQGNQRIGVLSASAVGSAFFAARARHLAHHRLLATDHDPDGELHRGDDKLSRAGLLRHFGLGLLGGYALLVLLSKAEATVDAATRNRDRRNLVVVQLALLAGLWLAFGWWAYPFLWLAPLVTLTAGAHLLRNFCEHAIAPHEEAAHGDRLITVRSNALERFVVAPFFMNYHAEHHLFPWVPAAHLPEVRRRLQEGDGPTPLVRETYVGALAAYARAL